MDEYKVILNGWFYRGKKSLATCEVTKEIGWSLEVSYGTMSHHHDYHAEWKYHLDQGFDHWDNEVGGRIAKEYNPADLF